MADLHVVVKHTKTIAEFHKVSADMKEKTDHYFHKHLSAHDNWREGEPVKAWYDADKTFCIEYESGRWWHYQETAEGLQWW